MQRCNSCSNLPTKLGLHLYSKGVKAWEIDLLAKFGLSISYKSVYWTMTGLAACEARLIAEWGALLCSVTAYDNFEQMEGMKAQCVNVNSMFHSVTTGIQLEGMDIPQGVLQQDMCDKQVKLGVKDVLCSPGNMDNDIEHQVSSNQVWRQGSSKPQALCQFLLRIWVANLCIVDKPIFYFWGSQSSFPRSYRENIYWFQQFAPKYA